MPQLQLLMLTPLAWHRAGQSAEDVDESLANVNAMPSPAPLEQLWDVLRLAPSNYGRIHIACDPRNSPAGVCRTLSLRLHETDSDPT